MAQRAFILIAASAYTSNARGRLGLIFYESERPCPAIPCNAIHPFRLNPSKPRRSMEPARRPFLAGSEPANAGRTNLVGNRHFEAPENGVRSHGRRAGGCFGPTAVEEPTGRLEPKAESQRLGYRAKIRPAIAAKNAARLTVSKANSVRRNLNPDNAHTSSVALMERRNAPPVYADTPCRTLTCKGALRDPPSASSPVCRAMTPALPDIAASIRRIAFPPIRSNADDGLSVCESPSVPWFMSFPLPRSMSAPGRPPPLTASASASMGTQQA